MMDSHNVILDNTAVVLQDVSVCYTTPAERIPTLKEYIIRLLKGKRTHKNRFWALKGINLVIPRGQVFGIIGNNGAGKSTLLQVVGRILSPTSGRLVVYGKVAPLLSLGGGFHPELSGRENIYLYGSLLGYSQREMEHKFEEIVDFSELWEFIDAPLRTYSSGMMARLGFAVATDSDADILLIDEILAVGDKDFQVKSTQRMQSFYKRGATILLVTHNMDAVKSLCSKAAWLDHGTIRAYGSAEDVVQAYTSSSQ